ncbi:RuBisCO large subunit C-terminal-like domain-containing protein [Devosia rhizoryzae]|nr:RuBisCO large subunit C-terminal-like domain-containing protein [Devosia rhizoryzae]
MARFSVTYWLDAPNADEARQRASDIALEQTVEIPRDIVPAGYVEDEILGRVEDVRPGTDERGGFLAEVSYSDDDVGGDFLQLLNVVFGNSALKTATRVEAMTLTDAIGAICPGPRYGSEGLRLRTGRSTGPILMSAIKPVGLRTRELADLAHQFALGGMDMIKDDHGLANQHTSPFSERLNACVDAVGEANAKSGFNTVYVPNITGPANQILDHAFEAQEAGAGAVMLAPALVGLDVARTLSADPAFALPIVSHPTFGGANVITPTTGFSHGYYFGLLSRLMGVDAVVYPNFGGRFGFSEAECRSIADHCSMPFGNLKAILPAPGGGMKLESVPAMREVYGDDVIYLVGGALLREKVDLPGACRRLIDAVRR